jgi:hypothetical protein
VSSAAARYWLSVAADGNAEVVSIFCPILVKLFIYQGSEVFRLAAIR